MNPKDSPDISPQALLELRQEPNAIHVITDKLRVKEMGPADHIRTKHEVKAFVLSGDLTAATELINRSTARRALNESVTMAQRQQRREAQQQ